jgi:predicted Rossmann fold nucleotide-binding protein DprA/Smf involved in DNA uptake
MKVIIAGSRDIKDAKKIFKVLDKYRKEVGDFMVISGLAKGPDSIGRQWAIEKKLPHKDFCAKWDKYGRAAGPIRNKEMAKFADRLIVFWDGKSKGSKNMIDIMKKLKKEVKVIKVFTRKILSKKNNNKIENDKCIAGKSILHRFRRV